MKRTWLLVTLLAISVALAHSGQTPFGGFWYGVAHPFGGLDHFLAMIAVGIWAAQTAGRAVWLVPLAFVGTMSIGWMLGIAGVSVAFVEGSILASVIMLGALILLAVRLPIWASTGLVGFFAIFHGYAHGVEIPVAASSLEYALGFISATAILHLLGIGIGLLFSQMSRLHALGKLQLLRLSGAAVLLSGIYMGLTG